MIESAITRHFRLRTPKRGALDQSSTGSGWRNAASKRGLEHRPNQLFLQTRAPRGWSERTYGKRCSKPLPRAHARRPGLPVGALASGYVRACVQCRPAIEGTSVGSPARAACAWSPGCRRALRTHKGRKTGPSGESCGGGRPRPKCFYACCAEAIFCRSEDSGMLRSLRF